MSQSPHFVLLDYNKATKQPLDVTNGRSGQMIFKVVAQYCVYPQYQPPSSVCHSKSFRENFDDWTLKSTVQSLCASQSQKLFVQGFNVSFVFSFLFMQKI